MQQFLERINEKHESMKRGSLQLLPVEKISENFLVEHGIIKVRHGEIVYLNTELIGKIYLELFNEDLILCLENLEHLVLENLELRELDLTNLKNLKRVDLKSCYRDSLIFIADNQNLETFDTSGMILNGKDVCPVYLYAHPNQVGKVFPKSIERKCKNAEGYLVVTLFLAPPKHKTVKSNDFSFKFLSRYKEAELGVILNQYWEHQPDYYTKYSTLDEASSYEKDAFSLLLEVEKKVAEGFYLKRNVSFDPDKDIIYPSLDKREFGKGRKIPDCMFQKV